MLNVLRFILLLLGAGALCQADLYADELYRIRVRNDIGGLVQVSVDKGKGYSALGRVKVCANNRIIGFAAASYTKNASVAATAVHGIRIKTGMFSTELGKAGMPLIFSLTPAEFSQIPKGYGGHIARSSSIGTDIHTGASVFREFAPYSGSRVYIEKESLLATLEDDYSPKKGDVFVIIVEKPLEDITSLVFENRAGGAAEAVYSDGRSERLAEVVRRVSSVGRYDATTFTGVGLINTNHGGVITVSTAPCCSFDTVEGGAVETRGGFMIQPYDHVKEQQEEKTQVMVLKADKRLEGNPPFFGKYISLHPSCFVQVKVGDADWSSVPRIVGKVEGALDNVSAVRINLPNWSRIDLKKQLADKLGEYNSGVKALAAPRNTSVVSRAEMGTVVFYIDGIQKYISNTSPYVFSFDTATLENGFHEVKVLSLEDESEEIKYIFVNNKLSI